MILRSNLFAIRVFDGRVILVHEMVLNELNRQRTLSHTTRCKRRQRERERERERERGADRLKNYFVYSSQLCHRNVIHICTCTCSTSIYTKYIHASVLHVYTCGRC